MGHSDKMNLSELCEKKAIEQVYVQRVENLWRLRFILKYLLTSYQNQISYPLQGFIMGLTG